MIRQIVNKLRRRSSKFRETRDGIIENGGISSKQSVCSNTQNGLCGSDSKPWQSEVIVNGGGPTVSGYVPLPCFKDVPSSEKQALLLRKLKLCCVIFDFTDLTGCINEKEVKRQTLVELVDFITNVNGKFTESMMHEIITMVSENLFRTPSPQPRDFKVLETFDFEEEGPTMDPAWIHLQIVYEFLLRFVASPEMEARVAKKYLDHVFVLKLLDLFDSEDAREREYLKTILHRIYGRFMVHRPFIRKAINNMFYQFIFETEKHSGIAELLEILGSIINGFALPLKEEHKLFLVHALIPLHKPKSLAVYHQQLSYCVTQFVEKDSKLGVVLVKGLLRYWPVTNSSKEVMFLSEVEEILESLQPSEFSDIMVPLFFQIGRCLSSPHFQVAERALFLWNNEHVFGLMKLNSRVIVPIVFSAVEKNARHHWNQAVHSLTINVRRLISDADPDLFDECLLKFREAESKEEAVVYRRELVWDRLDRLASSKNAAAAAAGEPVLVPPAVASY